MTFDHFDLLMKTLGFVELKRRWKKGGKMAYWLFQKYREYQPQDFERFLRKSVLRSGNRNNFSILLTR